MSEPAELIDRAIEDPIRELGGERLLRRLWRLYLEVAPGRQARLERLAAADDSSGVAEVAHLVRSSALSLGATEVARHAAELERLNGDPAGQRAELPAFVEASARLARHLESRLAAGDGDPPAEGASARGGSGERGSGIGE